MHRYRATHVPVDAVSGDVELSTDEPFRVRRIPIEDFIPRFHPLQLSRLLGPELLRVARRFLVNLGRRDVGAPIKLGRWLELPVFL